MKVREGNASKSVLQQMIDGYFIHANSIYSARGLFEVAREERENACSRHHPRKVAADLPDIPQAWQLHTT